MTKCLLIPVLLLFTSTAFTQSSESKEIKACFEKYKKSVLDDRGEEAVKWVDKNTIAYYAGIAEKAKYADSASVDQLSILDKLMVFSVRHRATKAEIIKMDGQSLIVYAIKSGMVGKNSVVNNQIGDVEVNGNQAKGQLLVRGEKTPLYFGFNKENGVWKVDLTSIFSVSQMAFKNMVAESGETENEFLFSALKMLTGKEVTDDIWKPAAK